MSKASEFFTDDCVAYTTDPSVKRGIIGAYHHVSEAHVHRYMLEFDYRYNTRSMKDFDRMAGSISGIVGKRLTCRRTAQEGLYQA
jgi:hypothetical protein